MYRRRPEPEICRGGERGEDSRFGESNPALYSHLVGNSGIGKTMEEKEVGFQPNRQ